MLDLGQPPKATIHAMIQAMKQRFLYGLLLASLMLSFGCETMAQRAIPDDNLAYPVLITLGNGSSGSGFYLNTGDAVFLVTAKHVLFDPKTKKLLDPSISLLSYSRDPTDSTPNQLTVDLTILQTSAKVKPHPTEDVAVVKLFKLVPPGGEAKNGVLTQPEVGVKIDGQSKSGLLGVSLENVKPFSEVLTGNDVMVFGYPSSLGLQEMRELDLHRPLLRKGIVAGTNPATRSLILDCPSYFGNSGGPVVEIDRQGFGASLKVVGVISQYVPFVQTGGSQTFIMQLASNSGYSIATPMDFVLELVK